ncbi:unnamed protein product, partial [Rotaria socialis]
MPTAMKDRMVDGAEIQEQIRTFNNENKDVGVVRTPKRHHSDEQRSIERNQMVIMNNDDEEFETVTHQRKKFQREHKDKHYEEQNDVICMNDKTNDHLQKQQHQQYIQKRKTTNSSRTFYNGEMTAMNHHRLRNTEKERAVKQTDQQAYLINHEHEQKTSISNHALHYAVEQHLPPINIKCDPKVIDQKQGTMLIKELFLKIEKNFKDLNKNCLKPLGFEYWFIDRDENLQCFTRNVELFVFLCNPQNYPEKLLNTAIHPNPPKRLPPQRSAILKYVPKDIHIDDIKKEISSKYKSLFNIEEMRGTIGARNRHIRIELSEQNE